MEFKVGDKVYFDLYAGGIAVAYIIEASMSGHGWLKVVCKDSNIYTKEDNTMYIAPKLLSYFKDLTELEQEIYDF